MAAFPPRNVKGLWPSSCQRQVDPGPVVLGINRALNSVSRLAVCGKENMRKTTIMVFVLALIATVPASGQSVSKDPAQAPAGAYVADWKHTQVLFSTMHL